MKRRSFAYLSFVMIILLIIGILHFSPQLIANEEVIQNEVIDHEVINQEEQSETNLKEEPQENETPPEAQEIEDTQNLLPEKNEVVQDVKETQENIFPQIKENCTEVWISNAEEAFVIGYHGTLQSETTLDDSLVYQWQMSLDGQTWTNIEGCSDSWYSFEVNDEVFSKWIRIIAKDEKNQIEYHSKAIQPKEAVCYIESDGISRAAGDVEGYDSLAAAMNAKDSSSGENITNVVVLKDLEIDNTITVGCGGVTATAENIYILKSKEGENYTIAPTKGFTGTMFLEDGEVKTLLANGKSKVILRNISIQGYPLGETPNGSNQVSSIFSLEGENGAITKKPNTWLTIQGNTQLLNPGSNIIHLVKATSDTVKIQSIVNGAEQGGNAGTIKMDGKISMEGNASSYIQVLGNQGNFTSDTDIVISPTNRTYSDNIDLIQYTTDASPYEIAYYRLETPGDYWIAFKDVISSNINTDKNKSTLSVQNHRPKRVFVKSEATTDKTSKNTDYNDGTFLDPKLEGTAYDDVGCAVETLYGGYARIRQLNNDEDSATKADLVIGETQILNGNYTISGTSYQDDSHYLQWSTPAELQRYLLLDGESTGGAGSTSGFQSYLFNETLLKLETGTLTLSDIVINGQPGVLHPAAAKATNLPGALVESTGTEVILSNAELKNNKSFVKENNSVPIVTVEDGFGSGLSIKKGNLTLKNSSYIHDCHLTRVTLSTDFKSAYGAGVYFTGGGTFTIENSSITNNAVAATEAAYGSGIYISGEGSKLVLNPGSSITGNHTDVGDFSYIAGNKNIFGIGISVGEGAELVLNGGSIDGNYSDTVNVSSYGGGIYANKAKIYLKTGELKENKLIPQTGKIAFGGAIYAKDSSVSANIDIHGNQAITEAKGTGTGGGIYLEHSTYVQPSGNIYDNVANRGGGVYANASTLTLGTIDTSYIGTFHDNRSHQEGGAIFLDAASQLDMYGGQFYSNSCGYHGGAIYVGSSVANLTDTIIGVDGDVTTPPTTGEEALAQGGNVSQGTIGDGGGIAFGKDIVNTSTLKNVKIQGNWADNFGGGLYVSSFDSPDNVSVVLQGDTMIAGNAAKDGGGIANSSNNGSWSFDQTVDSDGATLLDAYVAMKKSLPIILEDHAQIQHNYASEHGGAIFIDSRSTLDATQATIANNLAGGNGGGLYIHASDPTSTIQNAWEEDAGYFLDDSERELFWINVEGANVSLNNSTITNNQAKGKGGAAYIDSYLMNEENWADQSANYLALYKDIFNKAKDPIRGDQITLKMNGCTINGNQANTIGSGIYQGDASTVQFGGDITIGEDQIIYQDQTTIEELIPFTSNNGHQGTRKDATTIPKVNTTAHTGAYLTITSDLGVNGYHGTAQEALSSMTFDFPNYEAYKVIAQYDVGVINDTTESYQIETTKYQADGTKLVDNRLYIGTYDAQRQILLLPLTPLHLTKFGADENGDGINDVLPNAKFLLYDCDQAEDRNHQHSELADSTDSCWNVVQQNGVDQEFTSDAQGKINFGDLRDGTYMMKEIEVPAGYQLPSGQWRIVIDSTKALTPPADPASPLAQEYMITSKVAPETDTETENIAVSLIQNGSWDNIDTYQVHLLNKKTSEVTFRFQKVDAKDTNLGLASVKFRLYECRNTIAGHVHNPTVKNENGDTNCWQPVQNTKIGDDFFVSDPDGNVDLEGLASGDYMLVEAETLPGYHLPLGQWLIQIDATANDTTGHSGDPKITIVAKTPNGSSQPPAFLIETKVDEATGMQSYVYKLPNIKQTDLPFTGFGGILPFVIVGMLLMASTILLCFVMKQNKKNNNHHQGGDTSYWG